MIQSMTAFARAETNQSWGNATWELKAVNHRFLDANFRLPETARDQEIHLRDQLRQKLQRGKIECNLKLNLSEQETATITLNEPLLNQLISLNQTVAHKLEKSSHLNTMHLLSWPGVIETPDADSDAIKQDIKAAFNEALAELINCRQREGSALKQTILEKLQGMMEQVQLVQQHTPQIMQAQRQKVIDRIEEIAQEVDKNRLEQELVYYAQRMDIMEEIDRLNTHIQEMERVLHQGGAVGRRLDFLLQEMNRESNTIGSKSQHTNISHASVELKVLIEQIREQVQNIE